MIYVAQLGFGKDNKTNFYTNRKNLLADISKMLTSQDDNELAGITIYKKK